MTEKNVDRDLSTNQIKHFILNRDISLHCTSIISVSFISGVAVCGDKARCRQPTSAQKA